MLALQRHEQSKLLLLRDLKNGKVFLSKTIPTYMMSRREIAARCYDASFQPSCIRSFCLGHEDDCPNTEANSHKNDTRDLCYLCGCPFKKKEEAQCDHVIPASYQASILLGIHRPSVSEGTEKAKEIQRTIFNMLFRWAHKECNREKSDMNFFIKAEYDDPIWSVNYVEISAFANAFMSNPCLRKRRDTCYKYLGIETGHTLYNYIYRRLLSLCRRLCNLLSEHEKYLRKRSHEINNQHGMRTKRSRVSQQSTSHAALKMMGDHVYRQY